MRLSRHAKNRVRRLRLGHDEVLTGIRWESHNGEDPEGNLLYLMEIRGVQICAVVAKDDGVTVITVYDRKA